MKRIRSAEYSKCDKMSKPRQQNVPFVTSATVKKGWLEILLCSSGNLNHGCISDLRPQFSRQGGAATPSACTSS